MLKRIPIRIIWRDKAHFLGIISLILLASFLYIIFGALVTNIDENYKIFVNKYNQEDFHFLTLFPIDINNYEKKYNLQIEEKFTWDYEYGNKLIRFFSIPEKVNKPLILEGTTPKQKEIAIDPNFAKANKLKIGDNIDILGKNFIISGYVSLPDFIYITKNETDLLPDPLHFGIGIMNFDDLKQFLSSVPYRYYMVKGKPSNLDKFKEDINSRYTLLSLVEKPDNFRIIVTEKKMENAKPMSYVISGMVLVISSILLFIVLRRLINSMHAEIGTLYALGYEKKEIVNIYMRFPLYIWLFGAIPGGIIGYLYSKPFIDFYVSFISVPVVQKIFPLKDLLIGIFFPALFMFPSSYLAIRDLLKRNVVEIIRGETEKGFKKKFRMEFLNKLSFRRRIMLKQGLLHPSRELVLIVGVAFSCLILLYGITAKTALDNIVNHTFKNILKYNYMYIFNYYQNKNEYRKAERFNTLSFTILGTKAKVSLYGIERDSNMVVLRDNKGNKIDLKGFVISQALADKFNLKEGDILKVINNIDGKKYDLKIEKIADIYVGNSGYMNLNEFNKTFGLEENAFIGLYSTEKLDIPKENLVSYFSKEDIIRAFRDTAESVNQMFQFMYIMSFFLSFVIIYILSSLIVTENRKPLGIFKIMGYYNGELSSIFLGFSNISFLIGFLLGIPLYNAFIRYIVLVFLRDMDFSLKMYTSFKDIFLSFIILFLAFLISRYLGRRKINKISPNIILKEQAE
jgi:putative ABC transport system permease protein